MVRGAWVLVLVAGCGRIAFDPLGGDGGLGSGDSASGVGCWPAWKDGTIRFTTPRQLTELGPVATVHGDPWPTPDGLTLYYADGNANPEVNYATRPDPQATWIPQGAVTELAGPGIDAKLTLSTDQLVGIFSSDRGGAGVELYGVTRSSPTATFEPPVALANVNTALDDYDPHISATGLDLYFAPNVGGGQEVRLASRPTRTAPFVVVRTLTELAQPTTYSDPSVSPDELVIAYAGESNAQLYYAVRATTADNFGPPVLIPDVNGGTGRQTDVELTVDGCEIYFSSTRNSANKQVFVATVL